MSPEFRLAERSLTFHLECCECGGRANGNVTLSEADGSLIGELCDECDARITRDEQEGIA